MEILRVYGIPSKIVNIIQNSYRDTTCAVKSEGSLSSWFRIITGVRQGDIWSPLLFGLPIDFVMKIAVDKDRRGLTLVPRRSSRYPKVKLADLDYADDIALFEENDVEIAKTTEVIREIAGKLGLKKRRRSCPSGKLVSLIP